MKCTLVLLLLLVGPHAACGESRIETMLLRTMQDIAGIAEDVKMLQVDLSSMLTNTDTNMQLLQDVLSSMHTNEDTNGQVNTNCGCYFELTSWGKEDPAGSEGNVRINGLTVAEMNITYRGIGVLVATNNDGRCSVLSWQTFDTWSSATNAQLLVKHLANQSSGSIIAVISADETTGRHQPTNLAESHLAVVLPILNGMGVDLTGLEYRGTVAFLAVKGTKYQAVVDIRKRGQGPANVNKKLLHDLSCMHTNEAAQAQMLIHVLSNVQVNNHCGCYFELTSWGLEDSGGWVASVRMNGRKVAEMNRGYGPKDYLNYRGLGVLVATTNGGVCSVLNWTIFDTWSSSANARRLADHLANQRAGSIIAVISGDDAIGTWGVTDVAETNLADVLPILNEMGVDLSGLEYNGSVAFLAVKGTKYHAVVAIRGKGKGPAKVNYTVY